MVEIVTKESSSATVMSSMEPRTKTSLLSCGGCHCSGVTTKKDPYSMGKLAGVDAQGQLK